MGNDLICLYYYFLNLEFFIHSNLKSAHKIPECPVIHHPKIGVVIGKKIVAFGCIKSINKNEKKHTDLFSHLTQINENEKKKANADIQHLLSLFLTSDNL